MIYLLIFDMLFIVLFILASWFGMINPTRAGEVLLGIALINIVLAIFSYFQWPVLRGDISQQAPLTRRDGITKQGSLDLSQAQHPPKSFVFGLFVLGAFALIVGLLFVFL